MKRRYLEIQQSGVVRNSEIAAVMMSWGRNSRRLRGNEIRRIGLRKVKVEREKLSWWWRGE